MDPVGYRTEANPVTPEIRTGMSDEKVKILATSRPDESPAWRALQRFAASGLAAGFAEFTTLPIDIGPCSRDPGVSVAHASST